MVPRQKYRVESSLGDYDSQVVDFSVQHDLDAHRLDASDLRL